MEKFLVPQYIDVEPKIIGPITVRQFVIMLVCALVDFLFYKLFYFSTFVVIAVINTLVFVMVAFYRPNGMPFHYFILNFIQTVRKPKLRIWQKIAISALPAEEKAKITPTIISKKPLTGRKLSEISLLIDTGGAYNPQDWDN